MQRTVSGTLACRWKDRFTAVSFCLVCWVLLQCAGEVVQRMPLHDIPICGVLRCKMWPFVV